MLLSPRKNSLDSLFKEVRVFKEKIPRGINFVKLSELHSFLGAGAQRGANAALAGTGHGFSEMHALSIFGVKVWALNIEKKFAVRLCKTWQDNLTAFKNARDPKFVQNLSRRLFWGVPVRGTEIWKSLSKFVRKSPFFKFWQIFPNFSPPDWNPPKQSPGQILDKFWVSGVFEGCKGEKGSQAGRVSFYWK